MPMSMNVWILDTQKHIQCNHAQTTQDNVADNIRYGMVKIYDI